MYSILRRYSGVIAPDTTAERFSRGPTRATVIEDRSRPTLYAIIDKNVRRAVCMRRMIDRMSRIVSASLFEMVG